MMHLEDMPPDIGYASQKVTITDINGSKFVIGGQNGKTQLFVTSPFIDDEFVKELKELENILPNTTEHEIEVSLIAANKNLTNPDVKNINFYIDTGEEFGDFYGVRLKGEPFKGEFTKAVILISKDGAIFYDEFLKDLDEKFNLATLLRKITAAQTCYMGKGCH
jgi:thiol peroxidase